MLTLLSDECIIIVDLQDEFGKQLILRKERKNLAIKVEVWGDYACFSRPEMKTERVSYDMITPSAARGLLEAVYWHPGLKWIIDKIYVMKPIRLTRQQPEECGIRMTSIKRNEVKIKNSVHNAKKVITSGSGDLYLNTSKERSQRTALILKEVHYVIEAHFEIGADAHEEDNAGKFQDIMRRRLKRGQCYHQPYFGTREFPAYFREWEGGSVETIPLTKDLGYMLYDLN